MAGAKPTAKDVHRAAAKAHASVTQSIQSLNSVLSTSAQTVDPLNTLDSLEVGLYDGFRSLLSNLRHATTGLSLAFKPPITPDAAVHQLEKLEQTFGQCGTCVLAATGKSEGGKSSLLVEEWKEGVLEIGQALQRYLAVLEESAKTGAGPSGTSGATDVDNDNGGAYLVQTGAVWESIDRALAATPASELDAFRKRWDGQRGVMKDGWEEFKEFLEDAAEDGNGDGDESDGLDELDDEDDEWAELERGLSGGKMTPEERERAERSKNSLALHQILHASLPRFFGDLPPGSQSAFRPLLAASSVQVAAFDTAIASLYPEQDLKAITEAMSSLHAASKALANAFLGSIGAEQSVARTFITRWLAKADEEWHQCEWSGLSVASLARALP